MVPKHATIAEQANLSHFARKFPRSVVGVVGIWLCDGRILKLMVLNDFSIENRL